VPDRPGTRQGQDSGNHPGRPAADSRLPPRGTCWTGASSAPGRADHRAHPACSILFITTCGARPWRRRDGYLSIVPASTIIGPAGGAGASVTMTEVRPPGNRTCVPGRCGTCSP